MVLARRPPAVVWGTVFAVVTIVLVIQRPVTTPNLWWHLARGRCVFAGSLTPSQDLLLLDSGREADWLGGVAFYFAHSIAGNAPLAAIPLLAAVMLVLLARWELRRDRTVWKQSFGPVVLIGLPLLLWVVRDGLQPVPMLFDLIGMVVVWGALRGEWSTTLRLVLVTFLFALWSNLGPRPLWGLLVLLALCPPERFQLRLIAVALLGGCLTPRGLWSWADSTMLFAPSVWSQAAGLTPVEWSGIVSPLVMDSATLAFVLLWSIWVACGWPLRSQNLRVVGWSVPLLAAVLSRSNLPACGLWMLLDVCQSPGQLMRLKRAATTWWLVPLGTAAAVLMVLDAAGRGFASHERLGCGIAQQLDYRLLDSRLVEASDNERPLAWAPDSRSVGTVLWALPQVRMVDHPQRALLGHRLSWHVNLRNDIVSAHRAAYRRDDGSWGGWVPTLADWNTDLVFVPMEDVELNRALVETPLRPVDLDSPTVPYVDADQTQNGQLIVDILQQQAFVEVGPWQPTVAVYDGQGWRWDALERMGWGTNPGPAIRQSQLFRALNIPLASLRALLPVRRQGMSGVLRREFFRTQEHLAYQEWFTFGQSSQLRQLVVETLRQQTADVEPPNPTIPPPRNSSDFESGWAPALSLYLEGRLPQAAEELAGGDDQQRYAAAMIWLEAGDPLRARQALVRLKQLAPDVGLSVAIEYWIQQFEEFANPNSTKRAATPARDPA